MDHIMFPKVPIARWINQLWCINLGDVHIWMWFLCVFAYSFIRIAFVRVCFPSGKTRESARCTMSEIIFEGAFIFTLRFSREISSIFIRIWVSETEEYKGERNCILFRKLFWLTVRKNCTSDQEKLLKILCCRPIIFRNFMESL